MLVGNVLEKTTAEQTWQICADRIADWVRSRYLYHMQYGDSMWEDTNKEDPASMSGLRDEGFTNVAGLDYIFKWWGGEDPEELGGVLDVIWKTVEPDGKGGVVCYRTWIKLAERDFIMPLCHDEDAARQANRAAFRDAFALWRVLFQS